MKTLLPSINRSRRKLTTLFRKMQYRPNIRKHIIKNHKTKLDDIEMTLTTLELQIFQLQHVINNFLETNRNISQDVIENINSENLSNRTIKHFLPYMLFYMMMLQSNEFAECYLILSTRGLC